MFTTQPDEDPTAPLPKSGAVRPSELSKSFDWARKSGKFGQAGEGLTGSQTELSHHALSQLRARPPCQPGADKTDRCVRPGRAPKPDCLQRQKGR